MGNKRGRKDMEDLDKKSVHKSIVLTQETNELLNRVALMEGIPPATLMRVIIEAGLKRREKKNNG